ENFELGKPLDALVLDAKSPLLATTSLKNITATIVYSADANYALGTMVNGKWIVKNSRHIDGNQIKNNFAHALRQMKNR
ncbi:MAG: formimidoylglutamate deiminase, partial [Cyclobacteriaceae bacterium]|nr:formimidoylglutamate deiminase [Cyclobacteriaceae bacterium]